MYDGPPDDRAWPVSGSNTPVSWRTFSSSASAGAYPRPFCVSTWTTIGPSHSAALRSVDSSPSMSCPSIGPM